MGKVQLEIFRSLVQQRFNLDITLDDRRIFYKETIADTVEGVGHFEPLRHYAEVHLLLQPGPRGSGMVFDSACSTDDLDLNWQRLILTHLQEKQHLGVLTGSPITDLHISILSGRAHVKHTEGGDFRQATYRAVRHGLRKAKSVLLEPYYSFSMELPVECVGRAMMDIQQKNGSCNSPEQEGDRVILTGQVPVAAMRGYQTELASYTRGRGRLSCWPKGYDVCAEPQQVIEAIGYDADGDLENSADSVFCSHGAGFVVPWYEVEDHMHLESGLRPAVKVEEPSESVPIMSTSTSYRGTLEEDKELQAIYELNNDLIGWITIEGTNIDYPVMETPNDSDYYLHTSFYHEYSDEGCLYVRAACDVLSPSDNVTIYGHNMLNGSMFRHLHKYKEKSFYESHKYVRFDTLYARHTYEIIAVFQTSGTYGKGFAYHLFDDAKDAAEFDEFVAQCKALGLYDIDTTAQFGDKLITLSTCDKTALEDGRLVVVAKRIS